jgi:hypothetical protein
MDGFLVTTEQIFLHIYSELTYKKKYLKNSIVIYATRKGFIQASLISLPISAQTGKKPCLEWGSKNRKSCLIVYFANLIYVFFSSLTNCNFSLHNKGTY